MGDSQRIMEMPEPRDTTNQEIPTIHNTYKQITNISLCYC